MHVEWFDADDCDMELLKKGFNVGGSVVEKPIAVAFGNGDDAAVIEGTHDQLQVLLTAALAAVLKDNDRHLYSVKPPPAKPVFRTRW